MPVDEEEKLLMELEGLPKIDFVEFEEKHLRAIFKLENGNYIILDHEIEEDDEDGFKSEDLIYLKDAPMAYIELV